MGRKERGREASGLKFGPFSPVQEPPGSSGVASGPSEFLRAGTEDGGADAVGVCPGCSALPGKKSLDLSWLLLN